MPMQWTVRISSELYKYRRRNHDLLADTHSGVVEEIYECHCQSTFFYGEYL